MKTMSFAISVRHAPAAACTLGGAMLLLTAALAQGDHEMATADHAMAMDHSQHAMAMDHSHHAAMLAAAGTEGYRRSLRTYAAIPDVVLTDAERNRVRLRELLAGDGPVMLNFIFTTCTTICPVMTKVFAEVRTRLGREADNLRMVSISIDPEADTPAQLKAYAQKFGADSHWMFLTGRVEDVAAVQRAFDTYDSDKMNHRPLTLLRAAPGRQWVRIDGFASADQLAGEYRNTLAQQGAKDGPGAL
jgi:protein SCO1/2